MKKEKRMLTAEEHGRKGGKKVLEQYGKKHFSDIAKKRGAKYKKLKKK